MHYVKFIIQNYRGIVDPLAIDVSTKALQPVIGVNESGKTTILQAIFAFDHNNDRLNDGGRHLKDVTNLVETSPGEPTVTAEIGLTYDQFAGALGV